MTIDQLPDRVASTLAASAVTGATTSWVVHALPVVQLIAGILAGVSAALAIAWHVYKFRNRNKGIEG